MENKTMEKEAIHYNDETNEYESQYEGIALGKKD